MVGGEQERMIVTRFVRDLGVPSACTAARRLTFDEEVLQRLKELAKGQK